MIRRIKDTLQANEMIDGVHLRVMVSRGVKSTPYQHPGVTIGEPTIIIIAEHKMPTGESHSRGLSLFTFHVRRGQADVQDPSLNTHSKHNCIAATCNSTHFFIIKNGVVMTSTGC